jgi:tetratricopeptide (TPR) repeat protein
MLPDALSQANKKFTRRRFLTIFLAVAIVAAGIIVLSLVKFLGPSVSEPVDTPAEVAVPIMPAGGAESRSQFKQELNDFESVTEPKLAAANLPAWNPQAAQDIESFKNQALSAFAREDYAKALAALRQAKSLADATLNDWKEKYASAYSQALTFLNENAADKASLKIDEALMLKPSASEALTLKQRIDVLPEVIRLLGEADTARIENDLRKELRIKQEIVRLDPYRTELNEDILGLEKQLAETEFSSSIAEGFKAVENLDLSKANASLARARAIFPQRTETRILSERIAKASSTLSLAGAMTKGKAAIARDNWPLALTIFQQALKSHPDNGELINQVETAQKIVSLNKTLTDYLDRHSRLSSSNVASAAYKILQDAEKAAPMSRSLAQKADELDRMLVQYNQPVDLIIRSDNKTDISIRGVGNLGSISEKLVRLRPGKYTIEGRRTGYRSKLINVVIKIGESRSVVEVICDERI